jgi:hypothetical protein
MRGNLTESALQEEFNLVRASLVSDNHDHLNEFLSAWAET